MPQEALTSKHFGTANLLKAKNAAMPATFGAEAVLTAASKGDVPQLRMLHSFGQSLDCIDYDSRFVCASVCVYVCARVHMLIIYLTSDIRAHTNTNTHTLTHRNALHLASAEGVYACA